MDSYTLMSWIYERLVQVYNENPNTDWMIEFKKLVDSYQPQKREDNVNKILNRFEDLALVVDEAKWVILMFLQAETGGRITQIGSRGILLRDAVEDLRKAMEAAGLDSTVTKDKGSWREGFSNPSTK